MERFYDYEFLGTVDTWDLESDKLPYRTILRFRLAIAGVILACIVSFFALIYYGILTDDFNSYLMAFGFFLMIVFPVVGGKINGSYSFMKMEFVRLKEKYKNLTEKEIPLEIYKICEEYKIIGQYTIVNKCKKAYNTS